MNADLNNKATKGTKGLRIFNPEESGLPRVSRYNRDQIFNAETRRRRGRILTTKDAKDTKFLTTDKHRSTQIEQQSNQVTKMGTPEINASARLTEGNKGNDGMQCLTADLSSRDPHQRHPCAGSWRRNSSLFGRNRGYDGDTPTLESEAFAL